MLSVKFYYVLRSQHYWSPGILETSLYRNKSPNPSGTFDRLLRPIFHFCYDAYDSFDQINVQKDSEMSIVYTTF